MKHPEGHKTLIKDTMTDEVLCPLETAIFPVASRYYSVSQTNSLPHQSWLQTQLCDRNSSQHLTRIWKVCWNPTTPTWEKAPQGAIYVVVAPSSPALPSPFYGAAREQPFMAAFAALSPTPTPPHWMYWYNYLSMSLELKGSVPTIDCRDQLNYKYMNIFGKKATIIFLQSKQIILPPWLSGFVVFILSKKVTLNLRPQRKSQVDSLDPNNSSLLPTAAV